MIVANDHLRVIRTYVWHFVATLYWTVRIEGRYMYERGPG